MPKMKIDKAFAESLRGGYDRIIYEATGERDQQKRAAIEDCMRHVIFHSTLDWQTRQQLMKGARDAQHIRRIMDGEIPAPK